jgi:hypothetical protein
MKLQHDCVALQLRVELNFQADPFATFSLVAGTIVDQVNPNMANIVNLFLAKQSNSNQPPIWHYQLRSVDPV